MQQQNIISSSCRATPTKYTHNSFSHLLQHTLLNIKLISLISLIFLSVLIEAPPISFTVPTLQSFANYAAATYCKGTLENWDCGEVCQATKGTKVIKIFTNDKLNTKGFIALEESEKLIIVSYRGTEPGSFKNYITDLNFFTKPYPPAESAKARVHSGFYDAFQAIQPQVTDEVAELHAKNPDFRIGFMGHSLGGALATFSALDLLQKVPELVNNEKLFLATFGQPRVGDVAFAQYVEDNLKSIRTVIHRDPVPRLPPRFAGNYKHFGDELYIFDPDQDPNAYLECRAEDPNCSLSVPLPELSVKSHSGSYYGVSMRDCTKNRDDDDDDDDDDKEFENYDFSADPYFFYDPDFDYSGISDGVDGVKGVNGRY